MKAFVIKNKDLYKTTNSRLWTKDISKCAKWDTFAKARQYLKGCYLNNMKDCEVVEITIAEGDLEQQLAEKDKEIEELKEHIKFLENKCLNEINVKLVTVTKEKMQQIRKQVCDEIRKLEERFRYDDETNMVIKGYFVDKDFLNQIEKKEK